MLTTDLGVTRLVRSVHLDWMYGARALLVLYSASAHGSEWVLGASVNSTTGQPPINVPLNVNDVGVLARRLRVYMTGSVAQSTSGLPLFGIRELLADSCALPRVYADFNASIEASVEVTPIVQSVVPRRGSSAGGTELVVSFDGRAATEGAVSVMIAGVMCAVQSVSWAVMGGSVTCITGPHGLTSESRPGDGPVRLSVSGVGDAAVTDQATYAYADLWSRSSTWGGGDPPSRGDSVWIPTGQTLLLDTSPPPLHLIIVQGAFIFDRKDLKFEANYIFVMNGTLQIGTEEEPFLQQAEITMNGNPVSVEIPLYGAKVLGCRGCTLDLHGAPVMRSWTYLAQTAQKGSQRIWLQEPVDWQLNSQVMLTSTCYNGSMEEAETAVLIGLSNGGYTLELASPLLYEHLGETRFLPGGHSVEFRAN
eukprot:5673507-Prymnesium_polylepis.1